MQIFYFENKNLTGAFVKHFIKTIFPGIIMKKVHASDIQRTIENNIKKQYNEDISFNQILKTIIDKIIVKSRDNIISAELDDNIKIKNIRLTQLIRFIDSGNLEIKGKKIFSDAIEYSYTNIQKYNPLRFW